MKVFASTLAAVMFLCVAGCQHDSMAHKSMKEYQNFGTNKQPAKAISVSKLKQVKGNKILSQYVISLVNLTDNCLEYGIDSRKPDEVFPIPTVCRNCTGSFEQCVKDKHYSPVLVIDCTPGQKFDLTLMTKPDSDGNARGATWTIEPDCRYAGGVIGITP